MDLGRHVDRCHGGTDLVSVPTLVYDCEALPDVILDASKVTEPKLTLYCI